MRFPSRGDTALIQVEVKNCYVRLHQRALKALPLSLMLLVMPLDLNSFLTVVLDSPHPQKYVSCKTQRELKIHANLQATLSSFILRG